VSPFDVRWTMRAGAILALLALGSTAAAQEPPDGDPEAAEEEPTAEEPPGDSGTEGEDDEPDRPEGEEPPPADPHVPEVGAPRPSGPQGGDAPADEHMAEPFERAELPELPPLPPDPPPVLRSSTLLIELGFSLGAPPDESLDDVMQSHGYGPSVRTWGGDLALAFRTVSWLWIGGRVNLRTREWARRGLPHANGFGMNALAVAQARVAVNDSLEIGITAGAGGGFASLQVNDAIDTTPAPAVHASVHFGFRMPDPVRGFARVGYDHFQGANFNDLGHDLNLGGAHIATGVEIRQ